MPPPWPPRDFCPHCKHALATTQQHTAEGWQRLRYCPQCDDLRDVRWQELVDAEGRTLRMIEAER